MKQLLAKRRAGTVLFEPSSGNVFADLGMRDAIELDAKVRLAAEINRLIKHQRLTQVTAAARLEVRRSTMVALNNYELERFSLGRLMDFLRALGRDVEIRITPSRISRARGRIVVRVV